MKKKSKKDTKNKNEITINRNKHFRTESYRLLTLQHNFKHLNNTEARNCRRMMSSLKAYIRGLNILLETANTRR